MSFWLPRCVSTKFGSLLDRLSGSPQLARLNAHRRLVDSENMKKSENEREIEKDEADSLITKRCPFCVCMLRGGRREGEKSNGNRRHHYTHTHTRPGGSSKRRRRRKILYTIHTGDNWELIHHRFDRCDVRASNPLLLTYTHTHLGAQYR